MPSRLDSFTHPFLKHAHSSISHRGVLEKMRETSKWFQFGVFTSAPSAKKYDRSSIMIHYCLEIQEELGTLVTFI